CPSRTLAGRLTSCLRCAVPAWLLAGVLRAQTPHPKTESARAGALFKTGETEAALELYQSALNHLQLAGPPEPRDENRSLDLAEFLASQNASDSVVTVLDVGARALPRSLKIRSALAAAYIMTGQTDLAEDILKRILAEQPAYEVGYKLLGECYERAQE